MALGFGVGVRFELLKAAVAAGGGVSVALEQANSATSLLATTDTSWTSAPTVGNLLVLAVTSAGTFTTPSGWTLDTNATVVNNLAWYVFYRTADGTAADTPSYTQAGTYSSVWSLAEFSGTITGFTLAGAQQTAATGQSTTATPEITPAAGDYLLVALLSAGSSDLTQDMQYALDPITGGFTLATNAGFDGTLGAGSGHENIGQTLVSKTATLDGSTAVSTQGSVPAAAGATLFNNEGGIILAFTATAGGGGGGTTTIDPSTLDETNTGATVGGGLTASGNISSSYDGQTIENLEITGRVTLFHNNVTINNCIIHGDQYYAVLVDGSVADTIRGLTVKYCTIDDGGTGYLTNGIAGSGTFLRNNISKCENGILLYEASTITENYIHDLNNDTGVAHYDGIENNGVNNVVIQRNKIINQQTETSAIMMDNEFGPLDHIIINNNYLSGGGYTIYCDNTKSGTYVVDANSIAITNNVVVAGSFGTDSFYTSGVTFGSGNTFP